jgi:hypothetical protein
MVKIIIQSNLPYSQISVYKGQLHFPQGMNNAYNLNREIMKNKKTIYNQGG